MASEAEAGSSARDGSTIIIAIVAPSVFLIVAILLIITYVSLILIDKRPY
jgi:hypothetical protein